MLNPYEPVPTAVCMDCHENIAKSVAAKENLPNPQDAHIPPFPSAGLVTTLTNLRTIGTKKRWLIEGSRKTYFQYRGRLARLASVKTF